jgi:hypothetical protein
MTVEVTGEHEQQAAVDLDRLEEDATVRLGQLTEQRGRLALDALVDSAVHAELENVESEIRACQDALERMQLARAEQGGREVEAAAAADRHRREEALDRAAELQVARDAAARQVDVALSALSSQVAVWLKVVASQDRALLEAGRPQSQGVRRGREIALEAAYCQAMGALGVLRLEGAPPRKWQSLEDGDARPVPSKGK